jgi:hypothetical protein
MLSSSRHVDNHVVNIGMSTSAHVFHLLRTLGVGPSATSARGNDLWTARSESILAFEAVNRLIVDVLESLVAVDYSDHDRDLKHQLESLHQTLVLAELGINAFECTPLGWNLANIINPEVERCYDVLQVWIDSINRCRYGLRSTPISSLWRQVWWSGVNLEGEELASWKSKLSTFQKSLGAYLIALNSCVVFLF